MNFQILSKMKPIKNIKSFFAQEFFLNSIVHWVLIASLILNASSFGAIAFFIRPVDFPIILHYNVHFGVDVIGTWWQAYFLPSIALVIFSVNVILSRFFYKNGERIIAHMLLLALLMVQIGIAVSVGSIVMINY